MHKDPCKFSVLCSELKANVRLTLSKLDNDPKLGRLSKPGKLRCIGGARGVCPVAFSWGSEVVKEGESCFYREVKVAHSVDCPMPEAHHHNGA